MTIDRRALADFEIRQIHVNGTLTDIAYLRPLTARQLGAIGDLAEQAGRETPEGQAAGLELVARMVCYCLTDANGVRVYEDSEVPEVLDVPADRIPALQQIAEAAMEYAGITTDEDQGGPLPGK